MSIRPALSALPHHFTQKLNIAGQCTLYMSVHDDARPAEVFLRGKGPNCSSELIGLYDVIARPMSLSLQYGAPLEKVGDLLAAAKCVPCGPFVGHDRIKHCTSLQEVIGRHLLSSRDRRHSILSRLKVCRYTSPTSHHKKGPHHGILEFCRCACSTDRPDFSPPTVEDVHGWINAAVHPEGFKHRADYLKKFGVAPSRERIASAKWQRRAR